MTKSRMSAIKRAVLIVYHTARVAAGWVSFKRTQVTPFWAYRSFRQLTPLTMGRSNRVWAAASRRLSPPRDLGPVDGVLGPISTDRGQRLASQIASDGYVLFDQRLSPDDVRTLREWAISATCEPRPRPPGLEDGVTFPEVRGTAPVFDLNEGDALRIPTIQQLAVDRSMHAIAQTYLGCRVLNDAMSMWWSSPVESDARSEAAQLFHYDMSRPIWLKFFIYLTDVDESAGPHVFVRGSHRTKPRSLWRDGRKSDQQVRDEYDEAELVRIVGPAGTIFAADTMGIHKGEPPTSTDRLVLQIEYANSLFGETTKHPARFTITDEAAATEVRTWPEAFPRYRTRSLPG